MASWDQILATLHCLRGTKPPGTGGQESGLIIVPGVYEDSKKLQLKPNIVQAGSVHYSLQNAANLPHS